MQALRPFVPEQDENAAPGISVFKGTSVQAGYKGSSPGLNSGRGLSKSFGGSNGPSHGPRRALGNITNLTPSNKSSYPAATPAKTAAVVQPGPRRALADATKPQVPSTAPDRQQSIAPPAALAPKPEEQQRLHQASRTDDIDALAELYAEDDVECMAGACWEEQQGESQRVALLEEMFYSGIGPLYVSDSPRSEEARRAGDGSLTGRDSTGSFDEYWSWSSPSELSIPDSPPPADAFDISPSEVNALMDALANMDMSELSALED